MTSPIRIYNFIHRITKSQSQQLINLAMVSSVEQSGKKISFNMANENRSIFFFSGGESEKKNIYFDTEEDAKKEFTLIHELFTTIKR
jgi:hypothetical protein